MTSVEVERLGHAILENQNNLALMGRRAFLISGEGYYRLKIKQNEMGWTIFPLKKNCKKVIRKQMHSLAYFLSEGFSYKNKPIGTNQLVLPAIPQINKSNVP